MPRLKIKIEDESSDSEYSPKSKSPSHRKIEKPKRRSRLERRDETSDEEEKRRLKRQQETPEEAERRREKDREHKRARRALLKEGLNPDAQEYESKQKRKLKSIKSDIHPPRSKPEKFQDRSSPVKKHPSQRKEEEAERRRLKRQQETPEEVERRREKDREQKRARRALLKEVLPPDALQHHRAKAYESTLKKRYQNDNKPYNGPDGIPGETVGDRRRRLEAQRVRERREKLKLLKQAQIQAQVPTQDTGAPNQSQGQTYTTPAQITPPDKPVQEKIKSILHRRIVKTIYRSIETRDERQLMFDARGKKVVTANLDASQEEELHFKRFFVAQLESDFMAEKRSLVSAALELELGVPQMRGGARTESVAGGGGSEGGNGGEADPTTGTHDEQHGEIGVVVKIEEESDGEMPNFDEIRGGDEGEETVQDWLARLYTTEGDDENETGEGGDSYDTPRHRGRRSLRQNRRQSRYVDEDSDEDGDEFQFEYPGVGHRSAGENENEENFGPRPTPEQLREQKEKIFLLKMECIKRARFRKLQTLQEAVEAARSRWVAESNLPEDDERRAIVDSDRESMIERIYAEKRSLIEAVKADLALKRKTFSQESEEERNARIALSYSTVEAELLANPSNTPGRKRRSSTFPPREKIIKKPPAEPLDPVAEKAFILAKCRVRNRMGKAEYSLHNTLLEALNSSSGATALERFENILTSGENPRIIQFNYLVRYRRGKQAEEVLTYRKMLYNYLGLRIGPLLSRAESRYDRSGTFAKVPLYQRLFPEKVLLDDPQVDLRLTLPPPIPPQQFTPVNAQQSIRDFQELRAYVEKNGGVLDKIFKVNQRRGSRSRGNYDMVKSDKERHERLLALRRKARAKKKLGIDIELGSYLRKKGAPRAPRNNRKYDDVGNEIENTVKPKNVTGQMRRPRKKKTDDPDFEYQSYSQYQLQQGQYQAPYSVGSGERSGPVSVGGGSSCDYSGQGHTIQNQNLDVDDDDYGWLPMGSGMQLNSILASQHQQQQQQAHSSNPNQYSLRLVGDPTASTNYSQQHHPHSNRHQQQFYTELQGQQSGWNLSHQNQPHSSSQWNTIAFPNPISNLGGWNSTGSQTQGHPMYHHSQSHSRRRPPSPNESDYAPSLHASSDSDDGVGAAPSYQREHPPTPSNRGRRPGRPRKGEEVIKSVRPKKTGADGQRRRGGHPRSNLGPALLAAEVELPLNQNPAEVLPLLMDNADLIMREIVASCLYCEEVIVGPFEMDRHVKTLHPGKPLPSKTTAKPTTATVAVASIEKEGEKVQQRDPNPKEIALPPETVSAVLSINSQTELKFSCNSCPTQYKNPFALIEHYLSVHHPGKLYQCPIARRMEEKHKTKEKSTACAYNDMRYERMSLRLHLQRIHPKETSGTWTMGINTIRNVEKASKFFCLHCDKTCASYKELLAHFEATHGKRRYLCKFCGIYLREDDHLRDHVRIFHPEENMTDSPTPIEINPAEVSLCKICLSEFSTESFLDAHSDEGHSFVEEDKSRRRLTCRGRAKGCTRQFVSEKRMEKHERECSAVKSLKKTTGKLGEEPTPEALNQESIQAYMATPYKCEICRMSYLSLNTLRLHSIHIHRLHNFFHQVVLEKGITISEVPEDAGTNETPASNNTVTLSAAGKHRKPRMLQDDILNKCDPALFDRIYTCSLCPYTSPANVFHAIHLGYDAYLKRYCTYCQKVYSMPSLLVSHNEHVHGMDAEATRKARPPVGVEGGTAVPEGVHPSQWHSCQICNRGFTQQEFHTYHKLFEQGLGARRCTACDKIYLSYYTLRKHMVEEHGAPIGKGSKKTELNNQTNSRGKVRGPSAGGPGVGGIRQLKEEDYAKLIVATEVKKAEGSMTVYTCKVCLAGYKTEAFIRAHIAAAHKEDAFTRVFCTKCNSTFACRDNLVKHDKVVHVDKTLRFKCFACPEIFVRLHKLMQHSKAAHPGRMFIWKDAEKIHVQEEEDTSGRPVYQCNFCAVTFKTKDSMKIHVTNKHFSVHFKHFCEHCGLQLHGSLIKRHMQNIHPEYVQDFVSTRRSGPAAVMKEQVRLSIHQVLARVKEVYDRMDDLGLGEFRPGQLFRKRDAISVKPLKSGGTGRRLLRDRGRKERRNSSSYKPKAKKVDDRIRRSRRTTVRGRKRVQYSEDDSDEDETSEEEMELGSDNEDDPSSPEEDEASDSTDEKMAKTSFATKIQSSGTRTRSGKQPQKESVKTTKSQRGRKVSTKRDWTSSSDDSEEDENSSTGEVDQNEDDYDNGEDFDGDDGGYWENFYIKPEPVDASDEFDEYPGDCIFPDSLLEEQEQEFEIPVIEPEVKTPVKRRPGPASKTRNSNATNDMVPERSQKADSSDENGSNGHDPLDDSDDGSNSFAKVTNKNRQTRSSTPRPTKQGDENSSDDDESEVDDDMMEITEDDPDLYEDETTDASVFLERCDGGIEPSLTDDVEAM